MKREIYKVQDRAYPNIVKQDLKEQMQENLLTYFDAITLGAGIVDKAEALDGMCDIVIKTINEHER
jgi:hypothetical protein|tara:strand:- start:47 stop:244 length:198 start_codon:yes stop_codon:yes gene_type:complete